MTAWWQNVHYAIRMLRKAPGATVMALVTLAVGIGAGTLMFSIVNTLLWHPPDVREPRQLVSCYGRHREKKALQPFSYDNYVMLRDHNPVFQDLIGWSAEWAVVEQANSARRVFLLAVSANYFPGLGVAPARGRGFLPEEEQWGAAPVAVLSHVCWTRGGADPEIVGRQVFIDGRPFQIVGVMPKGFSGTALAGPDVWVPLGACGAPSRPAGEEAEASTTSPGYPLLTLMGRLKPGLSRAVAQAQMQSLVAQLEKDDPQEWENRRLQLARPSRLTVWSPPEEGTFLSLASLALMAVSAIVLAIACLNLANMQVVQGMSRHREVAIRLALGGGRARIVGQLLTESLLLALLAGIFGLVLAYWGAWVLTWWLGTLRLPIQLGSALKVHLDVRVLGATIGFCGIAAVLSGLRPALRLSRRDIIEDLKEAPGSPSRARGKSPWGGPRRLPMAGQVALSVVLVTLATLFTRSALKAVDATPGYTLEDKLLVEVDPRVTGYDPAGIHRVCEALIDSLRRLPGVQTVGLSTSPPFSGGRWDAGDVAEYGATSQTPTRPRTPVDAVYVQGDYFQSMTLPLLQGRYFGAADHTPRPAVPVIIDEPLARRLRPDGNALGCLLQWCDSEGPSEVVGIVPGVRRSPLLEGSRPHLYVPLHSSHAHFGRVGPPIYFHLRAAPGAVSLLLERIPAEIRKVDRKVAVLSVTTLLEYHRRSAPMWMARTVAGLGVVFGAMALFLAALGIYSVKGYLVAARTGEIGVRMALGATQRGVLIQVLRDGALPTLVGLALGTFMAIALARVMQGMIYGIGPADPVSLGTTALLLGTASLLAGYLPARRAARVDPMTALRYE